MNLEPVTITVPLIINTVSFYVPSAEEEGMLSFVEIFFKALEIDEGKEEIPLGSKAQLFINQSPPRTKALSLEEKGSKEGKKEINVFEFSLDTHLEVNRIQKSEDDVGFFDVRNILIPREENEPASEERNIEGRVAKEKEGTEKKPSFEERIILSLPYLYQVSDEGEKQTDVPIPEDLDPLDGRGRLLSEKPLFTGEGIQKLRTILSEPDGPVLSLEAKEKIEVQKKEPTFSLTFKSQPIVKEDQIFKNQPVMKEDEDAQYTDLPFEMPKLKEVKGAHVLDRKEPDLQLFKEPSLKIEKGALQTSREEEALRLDVGRIDPYFESEATLLRAQNRNEIQNYGDAQTVGRTLDLSEIFSGRQRADQLFLRMEFENGESLRFEIRENKERVIVSLRTTSEAIANFLETQKFEITRSLEQKNIMALIQVQADSGSRNKDRERQKREKTEPKSDEFVGRISSILKEV